MTGTDVRARLEAGDLACVLDGADVRDLSFAGRRLLTRLYIAVRDEAWNTIPFEVTRRDVSSGPGRFDVALSCSVDDGPIRAEWSVSIAGRADGEFSYSMRGRMLSSFRYAKLGLNLHHPLPESLGARWVSRRGDRRASGRIPGLIEPQFFVDGKLTGMFMPYDELVLEAAAGEEVVFSFTGDEFEMQDHRNWTDYNLKSYSTPLEIPIPLTAEPGQPLEQAVTIRPRYANGPLPTPDAGHVAVAVDRRRVASLPRIGSEFPDELDALEAPAADLVRELSLDYVRVNLDLTSDEAVEVGARRAEAALACGAPLELVLVVSPGEVRAEEVGRLERWLARSRPRLERVVVLEAPRGFIIGRTATAGAKVRALRSAVESCCGPSALVSATEQFFADLNRQWPDLTGVDGVGYTICPQVHAADDTSLMENSWGQADTVLTARARGGRRPVHVISVALIGKFGPYPGGVPDVPVRTAYGDPRQFLPFAAAWTVSSLGQLVDAEAASVTYFELAGDRGLVRRAAGSPWYAGPVYRVLESVTHWRGGNLVRLACPHGGTLAGLGMEWPDRSELLVANLAPEGRRVVLSGLAGDAELHELASPAPGGGADWVGPRRAERADGARGTAAFEIGGYGVARLRTG
ncbi:MAG TPA: hypothetical protein VKV23_01930 [Acidimicrobiales bacterium]|nr:hypothetical protein [Acidimicrobiales bacterium]